MQVFAFSLKTSLQVLVYLATWSICQSYNHILLVLFYQTHFHQKKSIHQNIYDDYDEKIGEFLILPPKYNESDPITKWKSLWWSFCRNRMKISVIVKLQHIASRPEIWKNVPINIQTGRQPYDEWKRAAVVHKVFKLCKQRNAANALVEWTYHIDPFEKALFLFTNKKKDKIKALKWDENGFVSYYKRLERGAFRIPDLSDAKVGRCIRFTWTLKNS